MAPVDEARLLLSAGRVRASLSAHGFVHLTTEAPGPLLRAVPATTPRGDDLLAWLEELGRRCESGLYRAERICQEIPSSIGLSLFPRRGAALAVAVTRGVEVASSAVFAPEQGCCIYSIRIRLLPAAEGGLSPQVPPTPGTP